MQKKVVIIGSDSYLATGIIPLFNSCEVHCFNYLNWEQNIDIIKSSDAVINFSISPNFSLRNIELTENIDLNIANCLKNTNVKYYYISSRKVYGKSQDCIVHYETDTLKGFDFYSNNKILTEHELLDILGENLCIMRVSNIIGEPVSRLGYKTFVGWISENYLRYGKLIVTDSCDNIKDFITKKFAQYCFVSLILTGTTGIFNVSAGFGIKVSDILSRYLGPGNLFFNNITKQIDDQFILNNKKLLNVISSPLSINDLYAYLSECNILLLQMKNK